MDIFVQRNAALSLHLLEAAFARPFALSFSSAAVPRARRVEIVAEHGTSGRGESFGPAELTAAVVGAFCEPQGGADALASEQVWMHPRGQFRDQGQSGPIRAAFNGVNPARREIPEGGGLAMGVDRAALRQFAKHRVLPAQ